MKHTVTFTLSSEDFDAQGNVIPRQLLNLFQKAADSHALLLGVDHDAVVKQRLLWVVTQTRYQVLLKPKPDESISITTWPTPPNRLGSKREYLMQNENNEILIKGSSNWVLMDIESRHLATFADIFPENSFVDESVFTEKSRRLRDFETDSKPYTVCPDDTTIDVNGHVNNTFYADFALAALGDFKGNIHTFQIDYLHEVLCHEPLTLYHKISENTALVKGLSQDGTRMFTCSITTQ